MVFSDSSKEWDYAFAQCSSLNSRLAQPYNYQDGSILANMIGCGSSQNYGLWLAITDRVTEGTWIDAYNGLQANWTNWYPNTNEPNNYQNGMGYFTQI